MRKRKGLRVGLLIAVIALVFTACVGILGSDDSGGVPASSVEPTGSVAASVSSEVTSEPTATTAPADSLTPEPTADPTTQPTEAPTEAPTKQPTKAPTKKPTAVPTKKPNTPAAQSTFSVHFIDVGQADAALVECDGYYMLIDGGNKADSDVIYSVLKKAGVKKLNLVVATHAHEDHIGGLPGAFNFASAITTLCPVTNYDSDAFRNFAKYAQQKGGGIKVPRVGEEYALGSATVRILAVNSTEDANDASIVLKIIYGKTSFLFTGDAERAAEQILLSSGADLSATVLKVGHHGSNTGTTYPFLREVMPRYAVISVGKGNSYGHPDEDTLSRLRDADVTVYRTDLQGDIYMSSDGEKVTVTTGKQNGTAVSTPTPKPTPKPTVTSAPTATPKATATPVPESGEMVWVSRTGSKYHSNPNCSGMKNPSRMTKQEAINKNLDACSKCY